MLTTDQIHTIEATARPLIEQQIKLMIERIMINRELATNNPSADQQTFAQQRLAEITRDHAHAMSTVRGIDELAYNLGYRRAITFLSEEHTIETLNSSTVASKIALTATEHFPQEINKANSINYADKLLADYQQAIEDMIASIDKEQ